MNQTSDAHIHQVDDECVVLLKKVRIRFRYDLVLDWIEKASLRNEKNVTYYWWYRVVLSAALCQDTVQAKQWHDRRAGMVCESIAL